MKPFFHVSQPAYDFIHCINKIPTLQYMLHVFYYIHFLCVEFILESVMQNIHKTKFVGEIYGAI